MGTGVGNDNNEFLYILLLDVIANDEYDIEFNRIE